VFGGWPIDTWTVPLDESEKLRLTKENLVATFELYSLSMHKSLVTYHYHDIFLEFGTERAILTLRLSDLKSASTQIKAWAEYEAKIHAAGEYMLLEYQLVVPVLRLAHEVECLERVFAFAGLSWSNIDNMHTATPHPSCWCLPGDTAFSMHPNSFIMVAKLLFFLTTPRQVETTEVVSFLPLPKECKWLRDIMFEILSQTELPGVLIARAATAVRDFNLAASHAQTALAHSKKAVKQMHAKHALSISLVEGQ
jgi:hypothetical protein